MTLNEDLKGRLDYKYFVMSDWGGTHSPSIRQGLDMEMPGAEFMGATISQMVNNGSLAILFSLDIEVNPKFLCPLDGGLLLPGERKYNTRLDTGKVPDHECTPWLTCERMS